MVEEKIKEYENLNQQYNKLVQENNELVEKNLLFGEQEEDLNQENTALQQQIKNNEQKINTLLAKGSSPPNKETSLGEETEKADALKIAKEKIAKLEGQLNQITKD